MRVRFALGLVVVVGCGFDGIGTGQGLTSHPATAVDGGVPTLDGSAADGSAPAPIMIPTAPCAAVDSCGFTVPVGWQVVAFASSRGECSEGLVADDVVLAAVAKGGVASCTCSACTNVVPACGDPTLQTYFDNTATPTCGQVGFAVTGKNGVCTAKSNGFSGHSSVTSTAASTGTCTSAASADLAAFDVPAARLCMPQAACAWPGCATTAAPYAACVVHDGDVACPDGVPKKTVVGASVAADCAACPCSVSAKCTGNLTFYDDGACTQNPRVLPGDGTCVSRSGNFAAYKWSQAPTNVTCTPGSAPVATTSLVKPRTVCCP